MASSVLENTELPLPIHVRRDRCTYASRAPIVPAKDMSHFLYGRFVFYRSYGLRPESVQRPRPARIVHSFRPSAEIPITAPRLEVRHDNSF